MAVVSDVEALFGFASTSSSSIVSYSKWIDEACKDAQMHCVANCIMTFICLTATDTDKQQSALRRVDEKTRHGEG